MRAETPPIENRLRMKTAELIKDLRIRAPRPLPDTEIVGVTEDSRRVAPGWVFVARPGLRTDGRAFIASASAAGAAAVLTDREPESCPCPVLLHDDPAWAGAHLAERCAGSPTSRFPLIGVTGTNGKTTVASLVHQAAGLCGHRCGLIGTVEIDDGSGATPSDFTTPPAERLSEIAGRMLDNGCAAAAMEVSSHSLAQHRVAGLRFAAAIFTNLTGDHLDYHGDMATYAAAKARLFAQLPAQGLAIINAADPAADTMLRECDASVLECRLGSVSGGSERQATARRAGETIELTGPWGTIRARTDLIGDHNAMNLLQAAAACIEVLGIQPAAFERIMPRLASPTGRLEAVSTGDDDITVLVDFAHTDDALANALRAARTVTPEGSQLWAVFGCGGDKDRTKRPRMGAAAAGLADRVIVTSDNPRTESPEAIIDEVIAGIARTDRAGVAREADRRAAIDLAISSARTGDVIVIAGKGHEREQILPDSRGGTQSAPFVDQQEASRALGDRRARLAAVGSGTR